jgi:hypothetical protein
LLYDSYDLQDKEEVKNLCNFGDGQWMFVSIQFLWSWEGEGAHVYLEKDISCGMEKKIKKNKKKKKCQENKCFVCFHHLIFVQIAEKW